MNRVLRITAALVLLVAIGLIVWHDWFHNRGVTSPAPALDLGTTIEREIVGIGAVLKADHESGSIQIVGVLPNSPASKAGLKSGLNIHKIDNSSTEGFGLGECVSLIRGPVGTKVRLELIDPMQNETNTIELTRERFQVPP